jgi:4-amino-4-deoxy-L-arabinose transferase-like glycosyltransferase
LTVLLTFLAARDITEDPWTPVVAASVVAFMPRFVFLSAFVTNDNLVNFLGAALALAAVRCVTRPQWWRVIVVGALIGLLIQSKLSALPAALVLFPTCGPWRSWRQRGAMLGLGVATALGVSAWYLIQNTVRYGDPLAFRASARYLSQLAFRASARYLSQLGGLGTLSQ